MSDRDILQSHNLRLPRELVAKVQHEDERDVEVRGEERLGVPVALDKYGVAGGEEDDGEGDETRPCGVGLEGPLPWELVATDTLFLHTVVETEVDEADDDPVDEGSGGDEVLEPREHGGSAVLQRPGPNTKDNQQIAQMFES